MMENDKTGIRLITTDDGSHSLFVPSLNETYHSFHGAVQESRHVFIEMGLSYKMKEDLSVIRIFEVGFGTGLNALLTADHVLKHKQQVQFTSIEAFPLDMGIVEKLNYTSQFLKTSEAETWFKKMHLAPWNSEESVNPFFTLKKIHEKLEEHHFEPDHFDVVYFDAFAPGKQAELWDIQILKNVADAMKKQSAFVTYCASGKLKRDLHDLGFKVETLPGPPGKKEMVRAIKL